MFNIQFIRRMNLFILVSVIAVGGSLYLMGSRGLNFGIDFKGGIKLHYRFSEPVSETALRILLEPLELGDFSVQQVGEISENRMMIKFEVSEKEGLSSNITEAFRKGLNVASLEIEQEETVGPKAGSELRKKGILAIIVSWLLMLIYVGYRFDFIFAPGAILALVHDVLITLGAFALTGREVSLTVIAALLTIIGYSINDTIVIYDRVRENLPIMEKKPLRELINITLNETLSRTIITTLTVLFVVVLMYLFGEGEFQNFGFAMTVGCISGTYSTIFVACPFYIYLKEYGPRLTQKFKHR